MNDSPSQETPQIGPGPELHAAFQRRLAECRRDVERLLENFDTGHLSSNAESMLTLRDLLHKLAGASGLYGHPQLGETASRAEGAIEAVMRADQVRPEAVVELTSSLQGVISEIDAAS